MLTLPLFTLHFWEVKYNFHSSTQCMELICIYPLGYYITWSSLFLVGFDDYMSFLCGINGSGPVVFNYTGQNCWAYNSTKTGADLNLPSVTIAELNQTRDVQRSVTNYGGNESYVIGWSAPFGVSVKVAPTRFFIASGGSQVLNISFNATINSSVASFGRIGLFGNQGHVVNIPLSVINKVFYNNTTSGWKFRNMSFWPTSLQFASLVFFFGLLFGVWEMCQLIFSLFIL